MEIVKLKLADLEPNQGQIDGLPTNPRQWTKTDIDQLARSLKETPELFEARPIIVVPHQGKYVILGGNLRYEASRQNKTKDVPAVIFPADTPVAKLKEIVIKDNGSFGAWDYDALGNQWDDLPLADWGVPAWDTEAAKEPGAAVQEDDFSEDEDAILVRCQPGDVWELGQHRLMCGDSIDLDQVKTLMGGAKADMVFTDPPYGVSYTDKNEVLNSLDGGKRKTKAIENDALPAKEMAGFWAAAFNNLAACTKERMVYYITAPQGGDLLLLLQSAIEDGPLALKHMLIWNKNNHVLGRCDYNYKHEPIIYGWKKKGTHTFYGKGKFKTTIWDIDKPLKNDLHPTMKPVELVANCLLDGSKEGDIVLDIFGGSGTTIVAAEETGRRCYMMELDPHYCDVILARWEKLTGQQAHKVSA